MVFISLTLKSSPEFAENRTFAANETFHFRKVTFQHVDCFQRNTAETITKVSNFNRNN